MNLIQRSRDVISSVKTVLSRPRYIALSAFVAVSLVIINSLLPQRELIKTIFSSETFSWSARVKIVWNLLVTLGANVTLFGKVLSIAVALTAGLSIALLVYYFRRRLQLDLAGGSSLVGIILSFIGVGCASCGSVILSSFIGLSATAAFIGFLPLGGLEIGLLSLVLLGWSIVSVTKKIQDPLLCKIPR